MAPVLDNVQSLRFFAPEAALTAGVLAVLVWDLVTKGRVRFVGAVTIALAALAAAGLFSARWLADATPAAALFGGQLAFDSYANAFRLLFAGITAIVLVTAIPTREARRDDTNGGGGSELMMLLLVVCIGMDLMAMARSLLMIYLAIEIVSVISFVMAGYKLDDRKSSEAALKYVVFGGVSSGVMLYGMSWIYGLTRSLTLPEIAERIVTLTREQGHLPNAVVVGAACILAGFAYKISAVPFHMWAPDVYEGSPTIVAAFLSVGPKAAGFAVLIRFFHDALQAQTAVSVTANAPWPILSGLLAVATMTVGNLSALAQTNVKRMLAYSSIAHAGYMLLAFTVFTDDGIAAIFFYIVTYCAMNLGAFLVVMAVAEKNGGDETIEGIRSLGTRAPAMAIAMAIFLFSLVGLPPFSGFVGKLYVFTALLRAGGPYRTWYLMLAGVGVVNTVISLFYYARILRAMYLSPTRETLENEPDPRVNELGHADAIALGDVSVHKLYGGMAALLVIPTVVLGLYWGPLYDFVIRSLILAQ
jgi:NADH-quinone oxidoreductase subunit N